VISQLAAIDILQGKNSRVWFKVEPSVNPDCDWVGYSHTDNCNFLIEAINAIKRLPSKHDLDYVFYACKTTL